MTKYRILRNIANDKKGERYTEGQIVTLKGWKKSDIKWLLARKSIEIVEDNDGPSR